MQYIKIILQETPASTGDKVNMRSILTWIFSCL
jgi:hypothetical protein